MALIDGNPGTSAWTTVRIDHGASFGARRYAGFAPMQYLDNSSALRYASNYPPQSTVFQWDGQQWHELGT
jgi:hypothetical protein